MREIGVYEAKTHLPKLLEQVEKKGQRFLITRHGRPVAELVPVAQHRPETIRQTIEDLKAFQAKHRLRSLSVKKMIEAGRRY